MRAFIATVVFASIVGATSMIAAAGQDRSPLYYQDPDGKPFYAAGPKKTADGRDFKPVFENGVTPAPAPSLATKQAPGERRILYYRNPMGLPDTSPTPKKDAMGMAYLPVNADDDGQSDPPGTVRVSPGRLQTLGVRTEAAEARPLEARAVRTTGILEFDERHLATVTTKVPGWIEHIAVSATGDPVKRGQVLASLYSPDLVTAEEDYLIASRMGPANQKASDQRLRALDVPAEEIARLRRTGRSSRLIPIVVADDGVVIDKPVQEGMRVEAGQPLYRTADLSSMWLIAQVQERDLGAIEPGERVQATFVAFPGRTFEGKVDFIYPSLSADTRTARVRIVLPNEDGLLRASMYATVQIDGPASGQPIVSVPNSAVLDNGTRQFVLLARGGGRFEPRPISVGIRGDDWVQVIDGVKSGEQVVVGANFLIDAESNLRAALQGFADGVKSPSTQTGAAP